VGFELLRREDATENVTTVTHRQHIARAHRREQLLGIEGSATFDGIQRMFEVAHRLAAEHRLSRYAFLARKR
jgi:hypothetical protein